MKKITALPSPLAGKVAVCVSTLTDEVVTLPSVTQ